jgi:PhzF family phenazine biosynthesis protein
VKLFTVDAFAAAPFGGNPAGVCLLDEPRSDDWMLSVAAELGYSETAFLLRDDGSLGLRWFTPTVEVDLCGHATLATAHVLFELGEKESELVFATRSGELRAWRDGDHVVIDLPAREVVEIPEPAGLREILGLTPRFVGKCDATWLAALPDAHAVRTLVVDLEAVADLPITALLITAVGEPGGEYDIVSRYFRPIDGIPEDPVTGSAHCILGPYWAPLLGKSDLVAYQASRRGGTLVVRLRGSRVELAGRAFTILRGELLA